MNTKKKTINVLIENDQLFTSIYNDNQKIQVIVNKTIAHFKITDADNRLLRRDDGSVILDYSKTIEEVGIFDGETLRFIVKVDKPNRDKGFA
tara:strand:+ start:715 stop:990 length:276 start_codon:yes stop_codon:yes gene_type:complete